MCMQPPGIVNSTGAYMHNRAKDSAYVYLYDSKLIIVTDVHVLVAVYISS